MQTNSISEGKKSEYMIVTSKIVNQNADLYIGNDKLNRVDCFKYLGVQIDSSLKFHYNIENLKGKLSQACGMSYRIKKYLNFAAAKKLYYSTFYSVIQYCIGVYGGVMLCTQRCKQMERSQDRMMKNLFSRFYPHSQDLYKTIGILKLPDIYRLRAATYMYRCLIKGECPTIHNNLSISYPQHSYETRNRNRLLEPFPRVETIRMNFQYQFVMVWNNVPDHIKAKRNFKLFKKSLIEYILGEY